MTKYLMPFIALILCITGFAGELNIKKPKKIHGDAQELYEMIKDHDQVIFYTLEPGMKIKGKKVFHGYSILGNKELKKFEHKKTILDYLNKSIEKSQGDVAACFEPRHGLRIVKGKKILDLVICFECASAKVSSSKKSYILIDGKRDTFDKVAKALKMEITKN